MTIRTVTAIAVDCDHREADVACDSTLFFRATDPGEVDRPTVLLAAAQRGWGVESRELCPKHRPTTAAAPTAQTGA